MGTLGVTQAKLITLTDYSKTTVSLLVNDRQDYTPEIIRDISKALEIAPFELLMHPSEAMALRALRADAFKVIQHSKPLNRDEATERTGTNG